MVTLQPAYHFGRTEWIGNVLWSPVPSGIGWATAFALAERGAVVGLLGRRREKAEELATRLREVGGEGIPLVADVSDPRQVEAAVARLTAITGRLDTVVANAGIAFSLMRINLDGVFYTARFTMPHLLKSKGTFTAISSDAGVQSAPGYAAYCASKHGVIGFIRTLALDHGPQGVRSNVICPGMVETPMSEEAMVSYSEAERAVYRGNVPPGRFGKPDEVAKAILHLSSRDASYSNGMVYSIDGGSTAGYFFAT
jgi:meso-butanediol dehydrogenase/(S,S)-butanediol dehydrogenase/diacetyl reductase